MTYGTILLTSKVGMIFSCFEIKGNSPVWRVAPRSPKGKATTVDISKSAAAPRSLTLVVVIPAYWICASTGVVSGCEFPRAPRGVGV